MVESSYGSKGKNPCGPGRYRSEEDLCAQWKAADAASVGAEYAYYTLWLSIVGTVGLLFTLYYTRKAVIAAENATKDADTALAIAERNAEAAQKQVEVSRRASHLQTRAYVSIKSVTITESDFGTENLCFMIELQNTGQSPAGILSLNFSAHWFNAENSPLLLKYKGKLGFNSFSNISTFVPLEFSENVDGIDIPGTLLAIGKLVYKDAFGTKHAEPFAFQSPGPKIPLTELDLPLRLASCPLSELIPVPKGQQTEPKHDDLD